MASDIKLEGDDVTIVGDTLNLNVSEIVGNKLTIAVGKTKIIFSGDTITFQGVGTPLKFNPTGDLKGIANLTAVNATVTGSLTANSNVTVKEDLVVKNLKFSKKTNIGLEIGIKKVKPNSVDKVDLTQLLADMLDKIRFLLEFSDAMEAFKKQADDNQKQLDQLRSLLKQGLGNIGKLPK